MPVQDSGDRHEEDNYAEVQRNEQRTAAGSEEELDKQYADIKAQGLALDMSRGKPAADQLDLSMEMMDVLSSSTDLKCETGVDCRNYGVMDGIPEAKRLLERFLRYHHRKTSSFMVLPV